MRVEEFENGCFYHVYNRGVDKRPIVLDKFDADRFVRGLYEFNNQELIRSIHENSFKKYKLGYQVSKLVRIVAYCLNPNHFHLLLEQCVDGGVSTFLKSHSGGYARYFNIRHQRSGSLFEGPFKVKYVEEGEDLDYVSVYVGKNDELHQLGYQVSKLVRSSWDEYTEDKKGLCWKEPVMQDFRSTKEYLAYAGKALQEMRYSKTLQMELKQMQFED